jgi:hypothetical protein
MTVLTSGDLTQENYFDYPAINASGLNQFLNEGAAVYWAHSPFNPDRIIGEESDTLILGSATHCLLLEGYEVFKNRYAVLPEGMRRDARSKEYQYFLVESENKTVITAKMEATVNTLVSALVKNKRVLNLISGGTAETPILWEKDGLKCKLKADYIKGNGELIIDYKTTTAKTPEEYYKGAAAFGYHRAAAWYVDGVTQLTGQEPEGFLHIIQNKDYPEIIGFSLFRGKILETGRAENEFAFEQIKRRLESGNWSTWPDAAVDGELPYWYNMKGAHQ